MATSNMVNFGKLISIIDDEILCVNTQYAYLPASNKNHWVVGSGININQFKNTHPMPIIEKIKLGVSNDETTAYVECTPNIFLRMILEMALKADDLSKRLLVSRKAFSEITSLQDVEFGDRRFNVLLSLEIKYQGTSLEWCTRDKQGSIITG